MTSRYTIDLAKPSQEVPWGFRLQGGSEFGTALSIQRVFSGTPADGSLQRGDIVSKVNGNDVTHVTLVQAQEMIKSAGNRLSLVIQRDSLPGQDLQITNAPSFAASDHHHLAPATRQQLNQPVQHFQTNSFPAQSSVTSHGGNVSNVKFQPKPDHDFHQNQNQNLHFQPSEPHGAWQHPSQHGPPHHQPPPPQPSSSSLPYHHPSPPHHHQHHEESYRQEQSGDVVDEHLRPVKEIKSMFNHGGSPREGVSVTKTGHPVRLSQPKKPQGGTKYHPPSPANKPNATSHVQSAKYPPVYQQRSSYNPLDFQGVNPKSPIPPNRPPGLVQRGAVDVKPRGTGLDYQQPNHFRPDHHPQDTQHPQSHPLPHPHQQPHHQPTTTPQGNVDPVTDFYLHGLNAKSEIPDFSNKSAMAQYSGKILPQRSEMSIKTPTSAPKKKEFKADQSAVYRILQEEEQAAKQRPTGQQGHQSRQGQQGQQTDSAGRAYQIPGSGGQSRLAELLEKDQAQLAPYQAEDFHDDQQQQHHQQYQQQVHHQQQYQQPHPQQYQQQQQQQHYHVPQQQAYSAPPPQKHLMTSTAQFVPSPSREQAPRYDYNDHYSSGGHNDYHYHHQQQQNQQHHYQNWSSGDAGRHNVVGHTGLPETDF